MPFAGEEAEEIRSDVVDAGHVPQLSSDTAVSCPGKAPLEARLQ